MTGTGPTARSTGSNGGPTVADTLDLDVLATGHAPEAPDGVPPAVLRIAIPFGPTRVPTEIPVAVSNIHPAQACQDHPCALHGRSRPHLLAGQPMRLRFEFTDRGTRSLPVVVERLCPRVPGRWHPDTDSLMYLSGVVDPVRYALVRAHECDCGCCASVELDLLMQDLPIPPESAQLLGVSTFNSRYLVDVAHGRAMREHGINPPTPCFTPDGQWQPITLMAQPRPGESWLLHHGNGMSCVSSVVTGIAAISV